MDFSDDVHFYSSLVLLKFSVGIFFFLWRHHKMIVSFLRSSQKSHLVFFHFSSSLIRSLSHSSLQPLIIPIGCYLNQNYNYDAKERRRGYVIVNVFHILPAQKHSSHLLIKHKRISDTNDNFSDVISSSTILILYWFCFFSFQFFRALNDIISHNFYDVISIVETWKSVCYFWNSWQTDKRWHISPVGKATVVCILHRYHLVVSSYQCHGNREKLIYLTTFTFLNKFQAQVIREKR